MSETIVVLDFGSQYSQLIARRIRECHVYSKIMPYSTPAAKIREENPRGIILSGGPSSVYAEHAPKCDPAIFELGIPVLGICYGLQLMIHTLGGEITRGKAREYGKAMLKIAGESDLFQGLSGEIQVWMSHGDKVTRMPEGGFEILGSSGNTEYCAVRMGGRSLYGIQFHPEVVHTPQGSTILRNFCRNICGCSGDWTMESFIEQSVREIRAKVGSSNVILGLSGGVDSSVAAALIHKAIGRQLNCIFVNNGLLRKNEAERVQDLFGRNFAMKLIYIDATDRFLDKLAGVDEPEKKRKIIGNEFVKVFDDASAKIENAEFLAQGTTYPDVIESVPIDGNPAAMIKSHHNVGGLQGRGARGRPPARTSGRCRHAPAVPRPRSCGAPRRGGHPPDAGHSAGRRRDCRGRDQEGGVVLPHLADFRGLSADPQRRRDGGRTDLRPCHRIARGGEYRWYDRRLGPASL